MSTVTIRLEGVEALRLRLGLDPLAVVAPAFERGLLRIERRMKAYPPPIPKGHWAANTSKRQKAAFFAGLRRGTVSTRRTKTLGRRWTQRLSQGGGVLRGEIGNNTEYGPWVQSKEWQAGFHRGRWTTDQDVLDAEAPTVEAEANRLIARKLNA